MKQPPLIECIAINNMKAAFFGSLKMLFLASIIQLFWLTSSFFLYRDEKQAAHQYDELLGITQE
jgi:hypothetical protein